MTNYTNSLPVMSPNSAESSPDQVLKNLRRVVDSSNYFPAGALIHDAEGNKTAIVFSQIEAEAKISSVDFETKFPAGTDLNDRRSDGN